MSKVTTVNELIDSVNTEALMSRPLSDWRPVLSLECGVYVCGENYVGKRFDQINYKFCDKNEAKDIVTDNLYALLRYKYFPKSTEETDDKIKKIVDNFVLNLKTTLRKVSLDNSADCDVMHQLPDYCVAFRNGVYNFKDNEWFFKYDIVNLEKICNKLYMYRNDYLITWYFDYNFEPLPINIINTPLQEFIEMFKLITSEKTTKNYCFELLYNISHNASHNYDYNKFKHLCQIIGYTILQSFSQYFVMIIGSGQNGKNSLFDGCFTHKIVPRPASNSLDDIENDRFITGSLENKAQNIFLETSAKVYEESKMIKALTGSMYQTIEQKGVNKYSSIINCKYIFAGNDQDKIKFSDTTNGFRRRINMFEIRYQWDPKGNYLHDGDYYETTFSDSLQELKGDVANTTAYIYFAMYGIMMGTDNFTKNFKFIENEWNDSYSNIDRDMKDMILSITPRKIVDYISTSEITREEAKTMLFDSDKNRLYSSPLLKQLGYKNIDGLLQLFSDDEACTSFFADNEMYMSVKSIQNICRSFQSAMAFSSSMKKMFGLSQFENIYMNKPYVKCKFVNNKLIILK